MEEEILNLNKRIEFGNKYLNIIDEKLTIQIQMLIDLIYGKAGQLGYEIEEIAHIDTKVSKNERQLTLKMVKKEIGIYLVFNTALSDSKLKNFHFLYERYKKPFTKSTWNTSQIEAWNLHRENVMFKIKPFIYNQDLISILKVILKLMF